MHPLDHLVPADNQQEAVNYPTILIAIISRLVTSIYRPYKLSSIKFFIGRTGHHHHSYYPFLFILLFPLLFLLPIHSIGSGDPPAIPSHSTPSSSSSSATFFLFGSFISTLEFLKYQALQCLNRWHHSHQSIPATESMKRLDDQLTPRDVTVQLFQWRYSDISIECEEYLGPIGYRYVQVSPPQEHIQGSQWWTSYQPVSYRIGSKLGSEVEFDQMIERCDRAGVGVIVDVVINHMTAGSAIETRHGNLGSSYQKYEYPKLYNRRNFHRCRGRGNLEITNYRNRYEVQNCELVGLADLKTGQTQVQERIKSYLELLVSKGVAGFRIDAAKHIPAQDLIEISKKIPIRVVQEVMYAGGEPIRPDEYMPVGRVHIFQGAYDLKRMFLSDGIAYLGKPLLWGDAWGDGYLPSSHSQIFITNWDLERNSNGLDIKKNSKIYILSQIFILVWNYGQVDIFSGYNYTNYDDGPQQSMVECYQFGWRCEHRHPSIVGATRLRMASIGEPIQHIFTSGTQRLAFSRGNKVFVAINNEDTPWNNLDGIIVGVPLPSMDNPYRNLLDSNESSSEGQIIELQMDPSSGQTTLNCGVSIPPRSAIGIMV